VKFFRRMKRGAKGSSKAAAKLSAKTKGKTTKPKGKARASKDEDEDESAPVTREIPGLILLALALVTFIALISEFVQAEGNLLGPWLGSWWASALSSAFGGFPILIYLGALGILGVQWTFDRAGWRPVAITTSIAFLLGLLLSIQHLGAEGLIRAEYQASGGWVGNFLAQQIFLPVFGTGKFGPYFVTSLLIFILVVWVFQISVAAWVKRGAFAAGAVSRTIAEGWRSAEPADAADYEIEEDEDEGFVPATPLKAARAPRAARGRKAAEAIGIGAGADEDLIPTAADTPEEEKAKLTALLERGSLEGLDPLTIRKLRDLEQERQRVTELNDWEEKTRDTEIGGLLGRKSPPAKPEKVPSKIPAAALPAEDLDLPELDLDSGMDDSDDADDFENAADDSEDADDFPVPAPKKKAGKGKAAPAKSLANRAPWDAGEGEGRIGDDGTLAPSTVVYDPYHLPDLDTIFPTPPVQALEFTEEELLEQKQLLEAQLNNFKVRGKVTGIHPGPVITRYEVELAPGEKVNRISGLSDDLALALRAKSIRILAPIPGKSLVGVEVPNRKAQIVYIKEILTSEKFHVENDSLKVALGKTISGDPYVADLTRAPHLLIAGQTGSGKSVCINSIMASLLASKSPGELRMILVDPKVVELKPYENIPHLLGPVITKPEDAVQALKWATLKMDERYDKLAKSGVRNIKGFNEKVRAGTIREEYRYSQSEEFGDGVVVRYTDDEAAAIEAADGIVPSGEEMPYILIVIDELADLMMVAGKEVETNIARIAQKARAVGIHLILATQRPSTNVITGTIKANLPTRIAFQVASQIDARTILDRQGAEKLLGRGDMLFRLIESPEPERLHGCFLDDAQCETIAEECARQNVNYPKVRTFNVEEEMAGGHDADQERDEKFIDAAELVVQLKQASVSLLQRRLGVGYAKAGRIVDQLERAGIVGRERGSKPREVLMNEEELYSFLRSHEATDGL
jgi:S-DNA-T family DNA segregation ATPase FtsK/SpoIIIE